MPGSRGHHNDNGDNHPKKPLAKAQQRQQPQRTTQAAIVQMVPAAHGAQPDGDPL